MTTPLNRDEIKQLLCDGIKDGCSAHFDVSNDVDWLDVADDALSALEARGCQIVQGEPRGWEYSDNEGNKPLLLLERRYSLVDRIGMFEQPLFAGKVQP